MSIYLDWNATTPPAPEVLVAMGGAAEIAWANPSSIHAHGRAARRLVEDARAEIARLAGVDARDVTFTSGGTEANNLALRSLFDGRPIAMSRLEHPSVTRVGEALGAHWLQVLPSGIVDLADVERALASGVGTVAMQAVNHETGIVQPVGDVIALARAHGARVHVDAVQAWGKIEVPEGWDSAAVAAHKMRGPKGIGALCAREGVRVVPLLLGGAQEKGLRPGTGDASLAAGFGTAARRRPSVPRIAALRDVFEASLVALGGRVLGDPALRIAHVSTLAWPGWIGAELVAALDLEGVSVSSGAACSVGTVEPSPVILAMHPEDPALAASAVRASLGETTTMDDIREAVTVFERVVRR